MWFQSDWRATYYSVQVNSSVLLGYAVILACDLLMGREWRRRQHLAQPATARMFAELRRTFRGLVSGL